MTGPSETPPTHRADELASARELAGHIVETVPLPLLVLARDLTVLSCNAAFLSTYDLEQAEVVRGQLSQVGQGQWNDTALLDRLREVLPEDEPLRPLELARDFAGGECRVMCLHGRRLDHVDMILLVVEDITERHRLQRQQSMMMRELEHRMKNVLAAIEGLADKSLPQDDASGARDDFLPRLRAYLTVQRRLLIDRGACDIRDLVAEALEPYGTDRIELDGGPVQLEHAACTALALVLHELQSNALKHGALSGDVGHVSVSWRTAEDGRLHLDWTERSGPPVGSRANEGFGIGFIRDYVAYQLGGQTRFTFTPEGLRFSLAFPWPAGG